MKRARHRYPVRDPLAGILSDWFGLEAGASKALAVLYAATGPLHRDELASRSLVAPSGIAAIGARIRAAGVDLPKGHGARNSVPLYELTPEGRRQVREAYEHTASLLPDQETEALKARITVLEDALGMNPDFTPKEYGLTPTESRVYGMIAKANGMVSRERIFWALYGDREDPPDDKVLDVVVHKIRAKIAVFGLEIVTHFGEGYSLKRTEKLAA